MAKGDYICDNCGFTWNPKMGKPTRCPNCDGKMIKPREDLFKDSGIDSF
jgi:predicted Zn-ribbon and HTH transcriptional regulator